MQSYRKITYSILIFLFSIALVLALVISLQSSKKLKVVFIDVGQGDSILISEGSQQVLIDGGKDGKLLLEKLGKQIPFWDRKIETIIETHPDADHVGGLIEVFRTYQVESVMQTAMRSQSQTFKVLSQAIADEKSEIIEGRSGQVIKFASGAEIDIIFPFEKVTDVNSKDTNSSSITAKLIYGESSFLFTGDLPSEQEKEILDRKIDVSVDILKVGHHGSKYSTGEEFLKAVSPTDAIISVGKNNSYGHPNGEILKRLAEYKINVLRTDEKGDIVYECQNIDSKCKLINN